jgi:hypothetical protein
VLVVVALVVGMMVMGTYNNLVSLGQGVDAQWAQVENQYQRRADLIPNLVSTVQGAANFEKSTLEEVIKARASVGQVNLGNLPNDPSAFARFQQAQDALSSALSRLMVVVARRLESQPELPRSAGRPREPRTASRSSAADTREGAGLQHGPAALPGGRLREPPRHEEEGLLQPRPARTGAERNQLRRLARAGRAAVDYRGCRWTVSGGSRGGPAPVSAFPSRAGARATAAQPTG